MAKKTPQPAGYWYLGQPYSGAREDRYTCALAACAKLTLANVYVYSPIVHWHVVAERHSLPFDARFWWGFNQTMLVRSCGLVVFKLPGWEQSTGLSQEIGYALDIKLPIAHMLPTLEFDLGDVHST